MNKKKISKLKRAVDAGWFGTGCPMMLSTILDPLQRLRHLEADVVLGRLTAEQTLEVAKQIIMDLDYKDIEYINRIGIFTHTNFTL